MHNKIRKTQGGEEKRSLNQNEMHLCKANNAHFEQWKNIVGRVFKLVLHKLVTGVLLDKQGSRTDKEYNKNKFQNFPALCGYEHIQDIDR